MFVSLLLGAVGGIRAQSGAPVISANGVVNAASFVAPPAAGSGLAQGSLISIFGTDLGPEAGVSAEFPLANELAGVAVEIQTADGRVLSALPLFVSAGQINALLPSETPVGRNLISVRRDGQSSGPAPVTVVHSSLGLFGFGRNAVRTAVAQRFVSEQELPLATVDAPARPGDTVVLWGTGLGPVEGPETSDPQAVALDATLEVLVGHRGAAVSYSGRSACCVGVDQINIRIPDDAPAGCHVPVWVSLRGLVHSNIASIPISVDGGPCRENPSLANPLPGAPTGRVLLRRSVEVDEDLRPVDSTTHDVAVGRFSREADGVAAIAARVETVRIAALAPLRAAGLAIVPPEGTCLVYDSVPLEEFFRDEFFLDAGPRLELNGPAGRIDMPLAEDEYVAAAPPAGLFLGPGGYGVTGPGGSEFPPFSAEISSGDPVAWQAVGDSEGEARVRGLTPAWTAAASPDSILLVGREVSAVPGGDSGAVAPTRFVCAVSNTLEEFVIPPAVLANLPEATAGLELASLWGPRPLEFVTDGPETGAFSYLHAQQSRARLGQSHLPSTPILLPDGSEVEAELAAAFGDRQRGLMFRRELPDGQGMLFLFENPGRYGFWMLNTLVPLDIIWLDAERRIVFVSENTPPCPPGTLCPTYGSEVVAQFVLELAAGEFAERGLQVGDRLAW